MSLLDDAREESSHRKGPRCSVSRLDLDLRAELDEALTLSDGRELTIKGVSDALRKRDVKISPHTLRRHHRGECSCEPG